MMLDIEEDNLNKNDPKLVQRSFNRPMKQYQMNTNTMFHHQKAKIG